MSTLLIGLALFFAAHSISIVNDPWRKRMAAKLGEWAWQGLYTLVSIAGFALIVWGYVLAHQEQVVLYTPPVWLHTVAMVLLVPVFPLLLATYLPGRIQSTAKHPMLAATMLWAFSHLVVNGTLADVLLFGAFLVWAILDRISMQHRVQRPILHLPPTGANDLIAIIAGLALYAAFLFWLHGWLIGVPLIVL